MLLRADGANSASVARARVQEVVHPVDAHENGAQRDDRPDGQDDEARALELRAGLRAQGGV